MTFLMKMMDHLSLKQRLTLAFAAVVLFAAVLSATTFIVFLMRSMKKSAQDQLRETLKVAQAKVEEVARGYEIYTDLISSDMQFGQLLAYDSAQGIQMQVEMFQKMSQGDLVGFVPRPEQYEQIKEEIFLNKDLPDLKRALKAWAPTSTLLDFGQSEGKKGWIELGQQLYIFAAKPILHFGTNMGFVFIGEPASHSLSQKIAQSTGTEIVLGHASVPVGSSFELTEGVTTLLKEKLFSAQTAGLVEKIAVNKKEYSALSEVLLNDHKTPVGSLSVMVSNEQLKKTRADTLKQAVVIALITAALSALLGSWIARAISTPLQKITQGIERITQTQDLSVRVEGEFGKTEIGVLANSFNGLLGQLEVANEKLAQSERRMKQELTMASTVQEMLFPVRSVRYGNLDLASFIEASTETGGDWFGYACDEQEKNVQVMIGDVTGHGMPAALITAICNGFFRGIQSTQNENIRTDHMLEQLNVMLRETTQAKLLMTFFASTYNTQTQRLSYANAGHNRPFVLKKNAEGSVKSSILKSPPSERLGESAAVKYEEQHLQLEKGDLVVWYTDGILENTNAAGVQYGKQRLLKLIEKNFTASPKELVELIVNDAHHFYDNFQRADDITLVLGRVV